MSVDLTCKGCRSRGRVSPYCGLCGGTGRRLPRLDEWDALEAERDHWWSEARREYDLAIETCNEVLANAGEGWDEDASIDSIAVKYVRWLEAERDRLQAELDAAHDARIEAQNPGIDMDYVRYHRQKARARAALKDISHE